MADAEKLEQFIEEVTTSQNYVSELEDGKVSEIYQTAISEYEIDKASMSDWLKGMRRGLSLASMMKTAKTYPFSNASNVKYPLIATAALQFNARAYPAIAPGDMPVKTKVWGEDPDGQKAARGKRVSEYMSYQLQAEVVEWEEQTDSLLTQLPIAGDMVRKWWFDSALGRPRCRLVEPGKFIINANAHLRTAPRCSEELELYPHEIRERIASGVFTDFKFDAADGHDEQAPQEFIEQHTRIDLDGDGYGEPYILTLHKDTQTIVRLVADFTADDVQWETELQDFEVPVMRVDEATGIEFQSMAIEQMEVPVSIVSIRRNSYFANFKFLPSFTGKGQGIGFGVLLGDISEAVDSMINMMIDAGHYASLGGGWIGSSMRLKGGVTRFAPGEWKQHQASGGDIRSSIVPMTFPGPDATMFQMLGMMIEAGREIASVKDVMTGEQPRQQQTATTTLALIEQGMMVFTAAYKRIYRALKDEFRLLAKINAETLGEEKYNAFHDSMAAQQEAMPQDGMMPPQMGHNGGPPFSPQADFSMGDMDIQPVADPRNVTKMQQAAKAQVIMEWSQAGMVDQAEALSRMAESLDIEDVDELLPKVDPMQQQMAQHGAQIQMQMAEADLAMKSAEVRLTMAKIEESMAKAGDLQASAMERMANAETEAQKLVLQNEKQSIDAMMESLKDERERLGLVLNRIGRMEKSPNDATRQGGDGNLFGQAPQDGAAAPMGWPMQ